MTKTEEDDYGLLKNGREFDIALGIFFYSYFV